MRDREIGNRERADRLGDEGGVEDDEVEPDDAEQRERGQRGGQFGRAVAMAELPGGGEQRLGDERALDEAVGDERGWRGDREDLFGVDVECDKREGGGDERYLWAVGGEGGRAPAHQGEGGERGQREAAQRSQRIGERGIDQCIAGERLRCSAEPFGQRLGGGEDGGGER